MAASSPSGRAYRSILRAPTVPGFAALAVLALLLLPAGTVTFQGIRSPSWSPVASTAHTVDPTARWGPDATPSHVGLASRVGTVDLRALALPTERGPPAAPLGTSTPAMFRHSAPTAATSLAFAAAGRLAVGPGFEGLNDSQCGCAPPDVIVAAGPTQVVEMVNLWLQVWTKSGVPVGSVSAPTFFGSGSSFLSDPRVLYDNGSGRWFASIFDAGTTGTGLIRFAVSSTSDAAGTWTVYTSVTSPAGEFPDQPILGVSDHVIAFGGNMFSETTSAFFGSEYWVVDKAALLNGTSAAVQSWGPNPNYLSIHPVQSLGPSGTQYFASSTSASSTTVALWAVTGVPPTASSQQSNLSVASYGTAPAGRAPGGGLIDSADTRVQSAVWQSGHLWLVFDDQCTPSGDTSARACVRVLEVATASAQILQDFDYGIPGIDLYYPAVTLDRVGDMTMVFGYSSSTIDPSAGATGQATSDPSGTLVAYRTVIAGSASMNCGGACRYGDYFGAAADPTDATAWVAAEFLTPLHNWDSWIAPVVTSGPASAVIHATPSATDAGVSVAVGLTGENVTCSAIFGLYCSAAVPLGDGSTVRSSCSASGAAFSWSHTYTSAGIYDVGLGGYLSVFSSASCSPGAEVENLTASAYLLTVSPAPSIQLSATPANGANVGQSISLSVGVAGGRSPFTFLWSGLPAGCLPSTGPTVNCTATTTGSWLITVTATDANGVVRVQTLPFVISPVLSTTIAASRTVLDVGQEVTLVATALGGSGSYGYLWTGLPTGCLGTNLSNLACTPTASGTFLVQQQTQDTNGASALSGTITLTVQPAVEITLVLPSDSVAGRSEVLRAQVTGGSTPYTITWSGLPAGCAPANSTQLTCTAATSGAWRIEVTAVDSVGGTANATSTWSVGAAPSGLNLSLTEAFGIALFVLVALVVVAVVLVRRRRTPPPSRSV